MQMRVYAPEALSLDLLDESGAAVIQYPAMDSAQADALLAEVVVRLGTPHLHDLEGRLVWEVRSQGGPARSQGNEAFPLHTDCSFEEPPPRYLALFVVRADQRGGGESLVLPCARVASQLSQATLQSLAQMHRMRVPGEFDKGSPTGFGRIFAAPDHFRYRSECVLPSPEQMSALRELDAVLQRSQPIRIHLPQGALLLLDNWRVFHGRTAVLDEGRHLKRVRFFGPQRPTQF